MRVFFPFLIMTIFAMSLKTFQILSNIFSDSKVFHHMNELKFPYCVFLFSLSHAEAAALLRTQISFQKNVPTSLGFLVQDYIQMTASII